MTRVTRTALADQVYSLSLRAIEDENYDIISEGGFMPEEFALAASNIFKYLLIHDGHGGWKFKSAGKCECPKGYYCKLLRCEF